MGIQITIVTLTLWIVCTNQCDFVKLQGSTTSVKNAGASFSFSIYIERPSSPLWLCDLCDLAIMLTPGTCYP